MLNINNVYKSKLNLLEFILCFVQFLVCLYFCVCDCLLHNNMRMFASNPISGVHCGSAVQFGQALPGFLITAPPSPRGLASRGVPSKSVFSFISLIYIVRNHGGKYLLANENDHITSCSIRASRCFRCRTRICWKASGAIFIQFPSL